MKQYVYFVQMQSHVSAALFLERYVRYFGSFILRLRCLAIPNTQKNIFWFFSETWSPSFCFVCNCFDDFRTNLPKINGRFHRKQNTKIPRRRWVHSKNFFLSGALLFSLVVTKVNCFENFFRSLYLEKKCFLFKCRVTCRLG